MNAEIDNKIAIVMPVYNEEESLPKVIEEWHSVFSKCFENQPWTWLMYNDGSKDQTLTVMKQLENRFDHLMVIDKKNEGHGVTCLRGYSDAINSGAKWVFQLDSDGQCDPSYFSQFWKEKDKYPVQFGYRFKREDGFLRLIISRIVSIIIFLNKGIWIKDANVPYRLIRSDVLLRVLSLIPNNFGLSNIFFSIAFQQMHGIHFKKIIFRNRYGGTPSVRPFSFFKHGLRLWRELSAFKISS